jgi:hypothetical protein
MTEAINLSASDMERLNKDGHTTVYLNDELILIRTPEADA